MNNLADLFIDYYYITMPQASANGYTWNYTTSGGNALIGDTSYTDGNATTSGTNISGAITIPGSLNSLTVRSFTVSAFSNCTNLTSVTFPSLLTSLGDYAFWNCTGLTSITIPNLVTTINASCFQDCANITSITIPDSVTTINPNAFLRTSTALVVTMSQSRAQAFGFSGNLPLYNQTFFGGTSVDFVLPPQLTITITATASGSPLANNATTKNTPIVLTFTSSASTGDFAATDISLTNGSLNSSFAGSGTVYTATFTPNGQGPVVCTINVPANKFTADGLNNNASNTFTFTFDAAPTMTITSTTSGVTGGSTTKNTPINLTFTASEAITDFQAGDISFNRGSLTAFSGSGTVYTATFTPTIQGAYTINVPVGSFADASGNTNTAASTFTFNFDAAPTMAITSTIASGSTSNFASIPLTFTASESITGFQEVDIILTNGSLNSSFAGSGSVYTATFTPTGQGVCTIDVSGNKYIDASGNSNTAASSFNWTYDSVLPTMTITSSAVTSGSTIDNPTIALTFTSSKSTNNFVVGDISITNGTLSAFASSSPSVYTATFTPTRQGLCTINVASGAYTDAAGNNNAAANTFSFGYIPKFVAFNAANNLEQTYIAGFLDVSGNINHRTGDLTVINGNLIVSSGNVSLNSGNLNMAGNVSINSGLMVNGPTTLQQMAASTNIDVSGATTLVGAVSVAGLTTFNNNVGIANNKKFTVGSGAAVLGGDVSMNSALKVAGDVSMNSTLSVTGLTTLANTSIAGTLVVNGKSTFTTDMSFTAVNIDICGNLRAQYPANSIPLSAIIGGGSLTATDVSMNAGLSVAGATTASTLTAKGNTAIGGALAVTGAATLAALTTTGAVTIGNTLRVTEKTVFATDVSFNGSRVDICGNLYANYPDNSIPASAIMSSGTNVYNTDVSMNAKLSIAGATALASTLVVTGKTTFLNDVSFGVSGSRVDICGNLYANYAGNSIPTTAIIGGIGTIFNTDVNMNAKLSVKNSIKIDSAQMQYKELWNQVGGDIDGQPGSFSGMAVSLSNDGSRVAIGNRNQALPIRVYTRDLNNASIGWSQLGSDISINEAGNTYYAHNVVLSGDGSVVAVSAYTPLATAGNVGKALVFQYQSGSWVKLGNTLVSASPRGTGTALSNDGLTIAVGSPQFDNGFTWNGFAGVFRYNGSAWIQLGSNISGSATNAFFGWSVALSSDGNIFAGGAAGSTSGNAGYVAVYSYNGSSWNQLGASLTGTASSRFGAYVSLSADGTILAASTGVQTPTYARVYKYTGSWTQVGSDITQPAQGAIDGGSTIYIGLPTSLSRDGTIIAIGTYTSNTALVYRCPAGSSTWTLIGSSILGETSGDYSGSSVALSGDGSFLAIGAINNDGTSTSTTNNSGQVRVFTRGIRVAPGLDIGANLIPTSLTTSTLTIGSTLNVSGSSALTTLTSGNANVGGTLRVTGATTTATLSAGNTNVGGTLWVTGATTFTDVSINSTLTVTSDVSVNSPVFVGNDTSFNSTLYVNRATSLNSTLFVIGATTLAGVYASTLSVTGATTMTDTAYVTGNSTIGGLLSLVSSYTFPADASLNLKLTVARDVSLNSTLNVARATTLAALDISTNMTLNSTLTVSNASTIMTDVSANAQLLVTGDVSLNSTMSVATSTILGSTLQVTGATTVSTLTTSGSTTIQGTLIVNGKTSIKGGTTFNSTTVDVSGNLTARGIGFPTGSAVVRHGPLYDWVQIGNDIDGETALDQSGWSTALSADGKTVAIGAWLSNSTTASGHVRVYSHNSNKTTNVTNQSLASFGPVGWTRVGNDIDGEANSDNSGYSVSLSADGSTVAIGATGNDGTNTANTSDNRGHVRVYKISPENTTIAPIGWTKLGNDIDGEAAANNSGVSVSLSADGTIVAIGADSNDGTITNSDDNRGHVRVYQYISQTWTQLGGDIDGEATSDVSGKSVSISSDGTNTIVAIGASSNSPAGHVRVYKYMPNKSSADSIGPRGWDRLGADIDGEAGSDGSGISVSLVANWPNVFVAIGAYNNDGTVGGTDNRGHVRVYQYQAGKAEDTNQSNATFGPAGWKRLGADIDGEAAGDVSGWSVSLAANWPTSVVVAIGAYLGKKPNNNICGQVRVYKYTENKVADADQNNSTFGPDGWTRLGTDIDGKTTDDRFGWSVSLSADGSTVAVGATRNDGTNAADADNRGQVRVFKYLPSGLYANAAIISTNATTTGDVTLYDAFNVSRATSLTGTLTVAGATTLSTINASSNASVGGALTVTGATTSGGTLNVSGATTSTTMTLSSNAVIGGTLIVSGAATMQTLNLTGPIKKC